MMMQKGSSIMSCTIKSDSQCQTLIRRWFQACWKVERNPLTAPSREQEAAPAFAALHALSAVFPSCSLEHCHACLTDNPPQQESGMTVLPNLMVHQQSKGAFVGKRSKTTRQAKCAPDHPTLLPVSVTCKGVSSAVN